MQPINIYCDESCHTENDGHAAMVLGAVICPADRVRPLAKSIRALKKQYGVPEEREIKWNSVSRSKEAFYLELVKLFLSAHELRFRALVVPDKSRLDHGRFNQEHDEFYYKMYFEMLKFLFDSEAEYSIYIDIKDAHGGDKVRKLKEVLGYSVTQNQSLKRLQIVRSDEVVLVQLADLFVGAVSYANRNLTSSSAKAAIVHALEVGGRPLTESSPYLQKKINIFKWGAS